MTYPLDLSAQLETAYGAGHSLAGGQAVAVSGRSVLSGRARRALSWAATSWFAVAVLGQLMLVVYVARFYGGAAVQGRFEKWNEVLAHGWVPGDGVGNLVLSLHLAFATLVTVGGALQLISGTRRLFPTFHRWNGRVYLVSAFVMSLGGLFMVSAHGTNGDWTQTLSISINAFLIITCAIMAVHHARARRFELHRRWAWRLFLVVSGGWFFRIGLMLWILVHQGPVGFDPNTFRGPAITILGFAQYLVPLFVLELFLRARASTVPRVHIAMVTGLTLLTILTATGIFAASMMLWLPHL